MVSDGCHSVFGGSGELFEEFLRTRQLKNYAGEGEKLAFITDDNYAESKLKVVRFDQTFDKLPYDASAREYILLVFNKLI